MHARSDWNARAPRRVRSRILRGPSTVHWAGTPTGWANVPEGERFEWMAQRMRGMQDFHMDGRG